MNGSQDFYLGWHDYENGLGDLSGEFWLGLSKIHRLTASANMLRVELGDFDGNTAYAKYSRNYQTCDENSLSSRTG